MSGKGRFEPLARCRGRPMISTGREWLHRVGSCHSLPRHRLAEVCHERLAKTDLALALGLLPMKEIGLRHWVGHFRNFVDLLVLALRA
jgi:hypothetical protein